jgi:hypothetical protein
MGFLLLFAHAAYADGMAYVPQWQMNGGYACYNFDQAKTLVTLDSKLQLCAQEETTYPAMVNNLKLANTDLQTALDKSNQNASLWQTQATATQKSLVACEDNLIKAQDTRSIGFGWAVAGALALVIVGGAVGFYVAKK